MAEVKQEVYPSESPLQEEYSKGDVTTVEEGGLSDPNHVDLHRALKARHITMIGMRNSQRRQI
jgi:amino acid transporter